MVTAVASGLNRTCVQVDGLEADDGGLIVLLILAVGGQRVIS